MMASFVRNLVQRRSGFLGRKANVVFAQGTGSNGSKRGVGCLPPVARGVRARGFSTVQNPACDEKEKKVMKASEPAVQHEFKAETRQLLDIVTNSIYTEKEVFVRELISNASDALEKLRHCQALGQDILDPELAPEILITTDEEQNTLTIADTGIGMTKSELLEFLGTIARSGSKAFLEELTAESTGETSAASAGIIGKFGVGFYSAFMVADKIEVFSRSAAQAEEGHVWKSDGSGTYEVAKASDVQRGSKIVIHLKDNCKEYASPKKLESIIRQYSNFVAFPIVMNGEPVNTVEALWSMDAKSITEEKYTEFYKYIANAFDEPIYRLHFKADAPIELKSLFFVGSTHSEKFGFARLQPGVSLYSRKVLIEKNSADILPDWLRFVHGVVDSEDLPISLSRESMQDKRLLLRMKDVLTKRFLKFLNDQATQDHEKYSKFFEEFGSFLKEGVCMDFQNKDAIAKLLRYESSTEEAGKLTSLDAYISRCPPDQDKIYFVCAPSRELAQASPYYEAFKKSGKEALFVYSPIDDFVMTNIAEYNGRKVVSAESAGVFVEETEGDATGLNKDQVDDLVAWMKIRLSDNVKDIKATTRLVDSPAVVTDHESASVRRMMSMVNQQGLPTPSSKHVLEVNPKHSIIVRLNELRVENSDLAETVALQLYDNSLLAAGLIEDGRSMVPRLTTLLDKLLEEGLKSSMKSTSNQ